jgi:hypothetical protein
MSNIAYAEKLVLSNENLSKKELVALVAKELNVSVPNARVYIYNVNKRLEKRAKPAAEHISPAIISKEVKDIVKRNASKSKKKDDTFMGRPDISVVGM